MVCGITHSRRLSSQERTVPGLVARVTTVSEPSVGIIHSKPRADQKSFHRYCIKQLSRSSPFHRHVSASLLSIMSSVFGSLLKNPMILPVDLIEAAKRNGISQVLIKFLPAYGTGGESSTSPLVAHGTSCNIPRK